MNQKGIVLSGLVYVLLIFFLLLLLSLLTVMWYRQNTLNSLSDDANAIYDEDVETLNGPYYNALKGVNQPVLTEGMTPVKWDGTKWVTTTVDDTDWYNYTTADKKWANVITEDDSMWVWIPRYVYKITSGWHTGTAGVIDVQFSMATDDSRNGTVTIVDTDSANDSNGTWTNHPAFTFGDTELTGIWVAKFEASGTVDSISIKPNITSLRNLTIGDMFTASRNMENNDNYGWGSDGKSIDTHMMKNSEWGAAAYLSQSTYGKNSEIWVNNSSTYITGCTGSIASDDAYVGCESTYNSPSGVNASTTGNIYGIYDMSGGTFERVSAYVSNGNDRLATYGSSIINAATKYKDVYSAGTTDTDANNYNLTINHKGDVLYETSSSYIESNAWNADYCAMPATVNPWLLRGGSYEYPAEAGLFYFGNSPGSANEYTSFRPTIVVGTGL